MKALVAFFIACAFATIASAATIGGTVTQLGGTALPNMTVAAYDTAGSLRASVVTDAQGRYTLTLTEGTYRVLAYDTAGVYATSFYADAESFDTARSIPLTAAQSVSSINFGLVRGGFIAGMVTSGSSPVSPRPAITVGAYNLSGTLRGFTKTDSSGAYRLVLPPGTYKVAAYDDVGVYATLFYPASTSFAGAASVSVTADATTTIAFQLSLGARISGRVAETGGSTALAGILVTAYDSAGYLIATASSSISGNYELLLPAGAYRIVFEDRASTYASTYYPSADSFETSMAIEVAAGASRGNIDAAMQRGGRIAGNVRDAESDAALASITVAAYNPSGTVRTRATTDANGVYALIVPPGVYKAGAYDPGLVYAPQFYTSQPAFLYAGPITITAATTISGVDFRLRKGGRFSGTVVDRATGAAVAGATVAAYDLSGTRITSVLTGPDGSYRLVVIAGTYKLVAFDEALRYANGYLDGAANFDASRSVSVAKEQDLAALNFSLPAGARISGSVVDLTFGAPVADVVVTAYDLTGTPAGSFTTDAAGTFAFAIPAGTYRFVAGDPLHRFTTSYFQNAASFSDALPVTVIAGGNTPTITFRLTAAAVPPRRRAARH
jgi:hypothetical protein